MRLVIASAAIVAISLSFIGCKSSSAEAPQSFCDTACQKDSIKFVGDHKLKPTVFITASTCHPDTLGWTYNGMGVNRKVEIKDFLSANVLINKDYVRCFFNDTAYAWLLFNNCSNGRGYTLKLPFNKNASIGRKSNAINNLDKKFSISDNITAYTDRGNLYLEDMTTGKTAMMTFGEKLDIDYDAIHEYIDSVNVTNSRIWAKVKLAAGWKELEKKITFE